MNMPTRLSDSDHPMIAGKAAAFMFGKTTPLEKVESLFYFIRDGIRFGFPPRWDFVKASEVLSHSLGYCNTKATLLVALCRAAGIPVAAWHANRNITAIRLT